MSNTYADIHARRHAEGRTYLEKCAGEEAARVEKMRKTSADKTLGDESEGATGTRKMGRMSVKPRTARKPKPRKKGKKK